MVAGGIYPATLAPSPFAPVLAMSFCDSAAGLTGILKGRWHISSAMSEVTPAIGMKTILVPIDFSECSLHALNQAIPYARQFGAEIVLLHVIEPLHTGSRLEVAEVQKLHHLMFARAEQELSALAKEKVAPQAPVRHFVKEGAPYEVITQVALKLQAEMIIISTHGRSGMKHFLLGSVAEKVVRHAHCPVLTVK